MSQLSLFSNKVVVTNLNVPQRRFVSNRFLTPIASSSLKSERNARVLVVDDEPALSDLLMRTLSIAGFDCVSAESKGEAIDVALKHKPELVVLDVMLPDGTGFELCSELREIFPEVPVIFLTAKDTLENKLLGLNLGADDYITKPFSVAEVVARINSVLRRALPGEQSDPLIFADLILDEVRHQVTKGENEIELSPTEFKLLRYFMQNPGRVISRQQLLLNVWEYDFVNEASIVEKFMSQLRKKIDQDSPKLFHTVRGFGYVLRISK